MKEYKRKHKITVLRMIGNVGKQIAWSEKEPVDRKHKKDLEKSTFLTAYKKTPEEKERKYNRNGLQWDLDVRPLISSAKWLHLHGLKRNKLTFPQILSQIGFQHKEDYVSILGKLVASRYANGLYRQYVTPQDGKLYNLTAKKDLLYHFVDCLNEAIELYKQRMEWLTTESRQIFGVIQEQSITIVLDFGVASGDELDLCREALSMVLRQQVSQIAKFNLIQAAEDFVKWQGKAVPVTKHSLEAAVDWLWELDPMSTVCRTGPTEALLEALFDETTEAVYYFAVGDIPECVKYLLLKKISRSPCPIHTVSFNAREEDTITSLQELSQLTIGRFHAFVERTDYEEEMRPINQNKDERRQSEQNFRKLKGDQPAGAGVREDVFLIWKELEEARNTLLQIQIIISEFEQSEPVAAPKTDSIAGESNSLDYDDSKAWLQRNGLKAQKLTMSKAFRDCTFRHINGIVDIKTKPEDESLQTDAESNEKMVNAKYCDNFPHAYLEDGTIVHIHTLEPERCRQIEERVKRLVDQMERRLQEVQSGSKALFGEILEDRIYILIDISRSMKDKLPVVKQKIFQLMREQLQKKTKFNFVKFDAEPVAWKNRLAEVNERNLEDALRWVKNIQIGNSTDILKALQVALADSDTQVIYLLTDGRPDQCEDIYLLKKEIERGKEELKRIKDLHDEQLLVNQFHGAKYSQHKHRRQPFAASTVTPQVEGLNPPSPDRPYCASEESASASLQPGTDGYQARSESPDRKKKALYAGQTRSSILRTLQHVTKLSEQSPSGRTSPTRKSKLWVFVVWYRAEDIEGYEKDRERVLPFAHVSSDKKLVTLINPRAVDLEAYKKRLQEALKDYERQV
ncbi:hypothetical protein lerEdw1_016554 [Lerista edwardsae]|nr:hypothetical protein lerEdw1_016554 [Lerista edwardsae]